MLLARLTNPTAPASALSDGADDAPLPKPLAWLRLTTTNRANGVVVRPGANGAVATATRIWASLADTIDLSAAVNATITQGTRLAGGAHSVPSREGTTRMSGCDDCDAPGRVQSPAGHDTCWVAAALTVRRKTPVPPRFVACESKATSGPPLESAITGWCASRSAGAPAAPVPRLTSAVVPAVTSRNQICVTPPALTTGPASWSVTLPAADSNATSTCPSAAVTATAGCEASAFMPAPSSPSDRLTSVVVPAWRSRTNTLTTRGFAGGSSPSAGGASVA